MVALHCCINTEEAVLSSFQVQSYSSQSCWGLIWRHSCYSLHLSLPLFLSKSPFLSLSRSQSLPSVNSLSIYIFCPLFLFLMLGSSRFTGAKRLSPLQCVFLSLNQSKVYIVVNTKQTRACRHNQHNWLVRRTELWFYLV